MTPFSQHKIFQDLLGSKKEQVFFTKCKHFNFFYNGFYSINIYLMITMQSVSYIFNVYSQQKYSNIQNFKTMSPLRPPIYSVRSCSTWNSISTRIYSEIYFILQIQVQRDTKHFHNVAMSVRILLRIFRIHIISRCMQIKIRFLSVNLIQFHSPKQDPNS